MALWLSGNHKGHKEDSRSVCNVPLKFGCRISFICSYEAPKVWSHYISFFKTEVQFKVSIMSSKYRISRSQKSYRKLVELRLSKRINAFIYKEWCILVSYFIIWENCTLPFIHTWFHPNTEINSSIISIISIFPN